MKHDNSNFEQNLPPEDRAIEELLSLAMAVTPPTDLAQRVTQASQSSFDAHLEHQLDVALAYTPPSGLASSVFASSVDLLQEPVVIARISTSVVWRQVALAACVVFAVLLAVRFETQPKQQVPTVIASNNLLSVEDEELLLEDLQLSEFAYLADTRELAFADVAASFSSLRDDIELWQYGLLSE